MSAKITATKSRAQPSRPRPASGDNENENKKELSKNEVDIRPGKQTGKRYAGNKLWKSQFIVIRTPAWL
jgi:hypothetical protein